MDSKIICKASIDKAYSRIKDQVRETPIFISKALSDLVGSPVYYKCENLQRTGSFKERGALNKILQLTETERKQGVIAASAGNHAQGVAYSAQRLGIKACIVMPKGTPLIKVVATKKYGAEVILKGLNYDEACEHARVLAVDRKAILVHAFDDPDIINGQGTIGIEIAADSTFKKIDTVVISMGGGGLISGVSTYLKSIRPDIQIIGVEAAACPAMKSSLDAGTHVVLSEASSLADGIAVKRVGEWTFPICQKLVDDVLLLDEDEIANAILLFLEQEKISAEGAGAIGAAALLKYKDLFKSRNTLVIVSGGNIDVNKMNRIIVRGLTVDGRICRVRIRLKDVPGTLNKLSQLFMKHETNILDFSHHRVDSEAPFGFVDVTVTFEAKGHVHIQAIKTAIQKEKIFSIQ